MRHRLHRSIVAAALTGAIGLLGVPAASAGTIAPADGAPRVTTPGPAEAAEAATPTGSIVFIKGNNVWLSNPQGTSTRRLTTNGTTAQPYRGPSQSTAGVIAAARGRSIVLLSRTGQLLKLIVPSTSHVVGTGDGTCTHTTSGTICGHGITETALSPDGTKVAFTTDYVLYTSPGTVPAERTYVYSVSTGHALTSPGAGYGNPSWSSTSGLVVEKMRNLGSSGRIFHWATNGSAGLWFAGSEMEWNPDLATANANLVYAYGGFENIYYLPLGHSRGFSQQPLIYCQVQDPNGVFDDPTWSGDGTWLAWEESSLDSATGAGQGVWIGRVGTIGTTACGSFPSSFRLAIPGGTDPDWGPHAL